MEKAVWGVRFRNEREFLERIERRAQLLKYLRIPMGKALKYQEESVIRGTIQKQRAIKSRGGRLFKPLTKKYEKRKRKLFPDAPILVFKGAMTSARSFATWVSSTAGRTVGKLIYRGPKYGIYHQDENRSATKATPRPWFGFRTGDNRRVRRIIAAGVGRILRTLKHG